MGDDIATAIHQAGLADAYKRGQRTVITRMKRQITAIEKRMREREDAGGLLDELLELQAELRELEWK